MGDWLFFFFVKVEDKRIRQKGEMKKTKKTFIA